MVTDMGSEEATLDDEVGVWGEAAIDGAGSWPRAVDFALGLAIILISSMSTVATLQEA